MGNVSPFRMVFGRKPRLSAKDVCFPVHQQPPAIPTEHHCRDYVQRLQDSLEGIRFHALDSAIEAKEVQREAHDQRRVTSSAAADASRFRAGDVVCVYTPSLVLKKLTYQ